MFRPIRSAWIATVVLAIAMSPMRSVAQLRPLEPISWTLITDRATVSAQIGASRLMDQRASLAGTEGDLWEVGSFALAWRGGRIVLETAGTAQRFFRERERFAEPYADVDPSDDGRRHDSGDYRISTTVRLTPEAWPVAGALRFGTRLPTTDNETGLDRDAVDFFATVGAAGSVALIMISGELGLGIHSTREARFEQEDLLLYSLRGELRRFAVRPSIELVGQRHGLTHDPIRGVEDLGEIRIGLRVGNERWMRIEAVKGYETFSPSFGVIIAAGITR